MSVLPGAVGPLVNLQDARRDLWDARAKSTLEAIAERAKNAIPLDDSADWPKVKALADECVDAASKRDVVAVREKVRAIAEQTAGALEPLGDYPPSNAIEGVRVKFRKVSKRLLAEVEGSMQEIGALAEALPPEARRQRLLADVDAADIQKRLIMEAVAEIAFAYESGPSLMSDEVLERIEDEGLVPYLWVTAREYQSLRPFDRARFGSSLPRTSASFGAASAPSNDERSSAATDGPTSWRTNPSTPADLDTSPASAPGASSFAIPASLSSSSSTGAPTEGTPAST